MWICDNKNTKFLKNADPVRWAPVLSVLLDGRYDSFMRTGTSVRVRDVRSGYFRFVINDGADIKKLTRDISISQFIAVDADYEERWRELFPNAKFTRYTLTAVTRDMQLPYEIRRPDDVQIVPLDASWEDLVVGLFANNEFDAQSLKCQLRENLSIGLIWRGRRVGFFSTHLNGELGPCWVAPDSRKQGFGTMLIREYLCEYLKRFAIAYSLQKPENIAPQKAMMSHGAKKLEGDVLLGVV